MLRSILTFVAIAIAAIVPLAARGATAQQILIARHAYDGKHVEVSGVVQALHVIRLRSGASVSEFLLCSARCIRVVAPGSAPIARGEYLTIGGTYYSRKVVDGYLVRHGIFVDGGMH